MESLELRIFREVAYERSISRAADKMGYVQSNVTAHIRSLEEELGTALFIRHSKGVTLTDDGMRLLAYADPIIELLTNAKQQLQKATPVLRIGATSTIAAGKLPVWLASFREACPQVRIAVRTDTQAALIEAVASRELDCAFVNTDYHHPKLKSVLLFREPLVLVAPQERRQVEELARQPIIVTSTPGCPYRSLLEQWVLLRTLRQPEAVEFDTVEAILKAVSLGMGVSLLPAGVVTDAYPLTSFPADEIGETYVQLVIAKAQDHPFLNRFIESVDEQVAGSQVKELPSTADSSADE
ncbi:LysR family transcriptional regulator [Gorillibacterium timonense]|uniref:LysR family transcriptional regulator n=1 Tax=Gorillibacterium timonense TaxID=1689269 RepID=UPI0009EB184E|nr:LysR family transcriptional regulator [Gorillibacterium timonense]